MPGSFSDILHDILRDGSRPLEPIATDESPVLARLTGVRAVLFDVYGTMFISGSGEVGCASEATCETAFCEALAAVGGKVPGSPAQGVKCFVETIDQSHAESLALGIEHPEVDIVEVWRAVLAKMSRRGIVELPECPETNLKRLALEYEVRTNPVWPMPDLRECLKDLRVKGLRLGIISNAQFFTPELFPALLGADAESWGFDPELLYYSYEYGRAKPGLELFDAAAEALSACGIGPPEVLYVGNDMLNDVLSASSVGFRTALFAGDKRSLRRRKGDSRVARIVPDLVLTRLSQLQECIIV